MNTAEIKKCPTCGCEKIENYKDLSDVMLMDGNSKCRLIDGDSKSEGFLSESLKKYRCPNGHEFTVK